MSDTAMKQVIVVREDLKMRKGKVGAQVAHASLGAVLPHQGDPRVKAWLEHSFTKVCLRVDRLDHLEEIHAAAQEAGLITCLITDAGRTEFNGVPTKTCVAIGPDVGSRIDAITGDLRLL